MSNVLGIRITTGMKWGQISNVSIKINISCFHWKEFLIENDFNNLSSLIKLKNYFHWIDFAEKFVYNMVFFQRWFNFQEYQRKNITEPQESCIEYAFPQLYMLYENFFVLFKHFIRNNCRADRHSTWNFGRVHLKKRDVIFKHITNFSKVQWLFRISHVSAFLVYKYARWDKLFEQGTTV